MRCSVKRTLVSRKTATPENVGQFTAVGYFFGRELYKKLGIPIGLINTSWGGTIVETWISKEAMKSFNEFSDVVDAMPVSMDALGEKRKTRLTNASCVVCEPLSPIS